MSFTFDNASPHEEPSSSPGSDDAAAGWAAHEAPGSWSAAGSDPAMAWDDGSDPVTAWDGDTDDWGSDDYWPGESTGGALPVGRPPMALLAGAGVAVVAALAAGVLALTALGGSLPVSLLAWVVAGPVAILVLGEFVKKDQLQRARAVYDGPSWGRHAPVALGTLALVATAVAAYGIASWVATR